MVRGGIGQAAGKHFVSEGASVLLVDLDEEALQKACEDIGSNNVSYGVANVTDLSDNEAMVALAKERYGGVDIFVANAGIEGVVKPITEYEVEKVRSSTGSECQRAFSGPKGCHA